jgi:cation diffusion facilitator CzcD-associated flavoprotein CzcO
LHLHTVKERSHLPGMPFAKELPRYPARADVVAYLEAYAAHFGVAPRTGEPVRRLRAADAGADDGFVVETARAVYRARAVVVATGFGRVPNPERLPDQERFRGPLLHSSACGGISNLFFVGYQIAATGHLREIGLEAQAMAAELALGS